MKWRIPAKTFLLGEYAAVAEASALILTTTPYFELSLTGEEGLSGIHPESPAGLWWQQHSCPGNGLSWDDPYLGKGGLGASSAQFLGSYLATCFMQHKTATREEMLQAYYKNSWAGVGLRPSGYDVLVQSKQGCVYINQHQQIIRSYAWPFNDLSFFLIHTGIKLATHSHLQNTTLPEQINYLSALVDKAQHAFEHINSQQLIDCINLYHEKLIQLNRVAEHSLKMLNVLKEYPEIVAAKGCGALGADVLLVISSRKDALMLDNKLKVNHWHVIATEASINLTHLIP